MKKSYSELKTLINKLGYENPEVVKYAHDLEEQERKDWEGKAPVRSTMSGACYALDFIPKFGGYEVISYETYLDYAMERGLI